MRGTRPAYTLETFLARRVVVDNETGCWNCQGRPDHHGYQDVSIKGKSWRAHRWVYEQIVGAVPNGLELDHLCRNTGCCNPEHLEPVTHAENMRRARLSVCGRGHELTDENVYEAPNGDRYCRPCSNARGRAHKRRKRAERPPSDRYLTSQQRAEIAAAYEPGLNRWRRGNSAELAAAYGVDRRTITQVVHEVAS